MAVSVHLLQLMYTQKKINFDKCSSGANTFGHKWHKLIFQKTVSVMVYVTLKATSSSVVFRASLTKRNIIS